MGRAFPGVFINEYIDFRYQLLPVGRKSGREFNSKWWEVLTEIVAE